MDKSSMGANRSGRVIVVLAVLLGAASAGCSPRAPGASAPDVATRVAALADECDRRFPRAPALTPDEFLARTDGEGWRIVDVRSAGERGVSMIPGAESVEEYESRGDEGSGVLVYCTIGCRSGAYVVELRERGVEAYNLRGGVLAWALSGRKFVTQGGRETHRVHVFGKRWNALPPGYEPVW